MTIWKIDILCARNKNSFGAYLYTQSAYSERTYSNITPLYKTKDTRRACLFGAFCAIVCDFELSDIFVEFFFDVGEFLYLRLFDDVAAQNDHLRIAQGFKVFERIAVYNHEVCGFSHFD